MGVSGYLGIDRRLLDAKAENKRIADNVSQASIDSVSRKFAAGDHSGSVPKKAFRMVRVRSSIKVHITL